MENKISSIKEDIITVYQAVLKALEDEPTMNSVTHRAVIVDRNNKPVATLKMEISRWTPADEAEKILEAKDE